MTTASRFRIAQSLELNRNRPVRLIKQSFADLMEIEKRINADNWEFVLGGRVDGAAANQLEIEILAATKQNAKAIYVNLAQATFLCSAGIRVLLQYHRQMKNKGLTLLATRPSAEVASALEMTGFPDLVEK